MSTVLPRRRPSVRRPLRVLLPALGAVVGAGLSATATAPTAAAAPAPSGERDVEVVAHRGSSGAAPENTLAAVDLALEHRSDVVENDVHRTRDGVLVVLHDTGLARTTDVEQVFPDRAPWQVGDFTLAEIKRLDAGSWFAPRFTGERVPTLAEWVDAVGRRAGMLIEPKSPALYPGIAQQLADELRALPASRHAIARGDLVVQSFDHVWLWTFEAVAPEIPVGLLFGSRPTPADVAAAATWADQVNPALGAVDEATLDGIRAAGLEAHVWTVNGAQDMERALRWGVDGIITNYPQVLRDVLAPRR